MKTVENQKIIVVSKSKTDKNHPYSIINLEASKNAMLKLDGNTFKVWYYIASNQDEYTFALSRKAVCSDTGISESTYHRAITKLKDNGFLIQKEDKANTYIFYEESRTDLIRSESGDLKCEIPKEKINQIKEFKF